MSALDDMLEIVRSNPASHDDVAFQCYFYATKELAQLREENKMLEYWLKIASVMNLIGAFFIFLLIWVAQ